MAMSLGVFSRFFSGETASLVKSSPSLRFVGTVAFQPNLKAPRTITYATASKPVTEEKKRPPRGITTPRRISPEMQAFLGGVPEIPRTQVLKEIWAYIKEKDLQDPANKKVIVCDEKLKKIFAGRERVGFLEIAGLITPHFLK